MSTEPLADYSCAAVAGCHRWHGGLVSGELSGGGVHRCIILFPELHFTKLIHCNSILP